MLKAESYKRGIVLSTIFNVFNKGLVFLNGILVAYFFGVKTGTDLFFYIYNSVLILGVFFASINGTVLIPESMRIRSEEGESSAMGFLNFFVFLYALIIILFLCVFFLDPAFFFSIISNFREEDLLSNKVLLYLALPLFGMICIINLFVDILTSYKFFTIPMIVGIINGIFSLIFILLFHNIFGIRSVIFGLLLSYTTNLIILIYLMRKHLNWRYSIVKIVKEKRIWKNFGFAQLGNITSTIASYTPMYILSGFNTGIITALTFAQQISSLPTTLITYQFSTVAGIKFNELYARKQTAEIRRIFRDVADFLHFIMIPLSCFIFILSDDIVNVLLGFISLESNAVEYVSIFLKYLGLLLPLYVINSLIARLFMASHRIGESFWYQVVFNVVLIPLLYISVKNFGIIGYPGAMVFTYTLNLICCFFFEKKYFNFLNYISVIKGFLKLIAANAIISLSIIYLVHLLDSENSWVTIFFAGSVYFLLLMVVSAVFRLNNLITEQLNILVKKNSNHEST